MTRRDRPRRRRAGGIAVSVAVLAAASLAGPAQTAAAPGHRALSRHSAPARHPAAPSAVRACDPVGPGYAACQASFRSVPAAARAGAPLNSAGLEAAASRRPAGTVAPPKRGFGPAEIRSLYDLDDTKGTGQTVAIVDAYSNPHAVRDLAAFRSAYGLAPCTTADGCFRAVNEKGGSTLPPGDPGWGLEIDLDLQAVSSACPNCKILLVDAKNESNANLGAAVNRAVALGATIVSNSYGGDEYNGVRAAGRKYYTHPGVAVVAASGDDGFTTASFPASWTRSIAVGGTRAVHTHDGWKQTAWDGGGSGCSAWITKPAWQHDPHCLMRTTSDVSALADPETGLAVYDTYGLATFGLKPGWVVVGGTSLATPLVAAMIALAGNAADLDSARYIYQHRTGLYDVVHGSNGDFQGCGGDYLCTAKPGYDAPTGVGTPVGTSAL